MAQNVSRRNFLMGTGLMGMGLVGAGLAGCSQPQQASSLASTAESVEDEDWLGAAPGTKPEDCASTIETDVLVIGAGIAGSMCAYGAVREGSKVLVVDKHTTPHCGGGCVSFVNSKYQRSQGVQEYDPLKLAYQLFNECQSRPDMELIMSWAFESGDILDELLETVCDPYGVPYMVKMESFDPEYELQANYNTGISFNDLNNDSLLLLIEGVQKYLVDNGVDLRFGVKGEELVQDEAGRVVGAIITDENGEKVYVAASKGVMVCTGSYGANEKMVKEFYSPTMQRLWSECNIYNSYYTPESAPTEPVDTGDGHKMMCWAGAQMEETTHPYCGWPLGGALGSPYLAVNQMGQRYYNEAVYMLNSLPQFLEQPNQKGLYTWQIVSNEETPMPNVAGVPEGVLEQFIANGETYTADTLEELAAQIDVEPEVLTATVERYNELCETGFDEDFGKHKEFMIPVKTPPFKAVRVTYGIAVTLGGVKTNRNMQVLDENSNPIPGLYAVGNTAGRRFGWAYQNRHNAMTNTFSLVHGYIAGHACGKEA